MVETNGNLRKAKRVELEIPVRISRHADPTSEGNFFISSLTELSPEGAFISTSATYQPGAVLNMEFNLPAPHDDHHSVHALGKVAWQASGHAAPGAVSRAGMGVGVHFVLIAQKEKELIQTFIAKAPTKPAYSRRTPLA